MAFEIIYKKNYFFSKNLAKSGVLAKSDIFIYIYTTIQ